MRLNRPLCLSDLKSTQLHYLSKSDVPHLVVDTSCVETFQLGECINQKGDLERLNLDATLQAGRRPLRFSIIDSEMRWIGVVLLDSEGPEWSYEGQHEFFSSFGGAVLRARRRKA